jgi:OOP family OmpA-OmpF porin
MKRIMMLLVVCSLTLVAFQLISWAQEPDVEGSKDHPLFNRMPGFYIYDYDDQEFSSAEFYDSADKEYIVEGHKYMITYWLQDDITPQGQLNIIKNYTNAIRKIGGTILREDTEATMKVTQGGTESWIHVWSNTDGSNVVLTIIDKKVMEQKIVADPKAMAGDIGATGHVAIYGIYFDTDKADIKPESEPTLKAIAQMLKDKPSLKVYVVGHTDSTGNLDHNMDLSNRRAQSVMNALVSKYGIDASRLKAKGVGPLCPVASNSSEEGRGKNRRVELVEM